MKIAKDADRDPPVSRFYGPGIAALILAATATLVLIVP